MLFVSKIRDLRLIRRPSDRIMDEQRNPIILKGERVEFSNFRFTTNDEDLIAWLLNHPLYGSQFTSDKLQDKPTGKQFKPDILSDRDVIQVARDTIKDYDKSTIAPGAQFDQMIKSNKKKKKIAIPQMVKGMMATVQAAAAQERAYAAQAKQAKERIQETTKEPSLTKEDIAGMIKSEIRDAMAVMVDLIKSEKGGTITPPAAPKKKFHCPECGEEFATGVQVGQHKKDVHTVSIPSADQNDNVQEDLKPTDYITKSLEQE